MSAGLDDATGAAWRVAVDLWHTPMTGLYGVRCEPVALWYPGGVLEDGLVGIRYEERSVGRVD